MARKDLLIIVGSNFETVPTGMKKIYIAIIVVGVLLISGYIFLQYSLRKNGNDNNGTSSSAQTINEQQINSTSSPLNLEPLFIKKLQQMVHKGSHGLYHLSLDSLQLDVLQSTVKLVNAKLTPNTEVIDSLDKAKLLPNDIFTISFNDLFISNINLDDVITKKTIDLDVVRITNPQIEIIHNKKSYNKKADSLTLYQKLMEQVTSITVNKIIVEGGNVEMNKHTQQATSFKNINILLQNIKIDSTTQYSSNRFLFAQNARFSLNDFEVKSADNLYLYKVKSLTVLANERRIEAKNIQLVPRYGKQAFTEKLKERKERMELTLPNISVSNVDWYHLLNNEGIEADEIKINGGHVNIYLNRSLPATKSKIGSFPHQLIMNIQSPVDIKKISFKNFDIAYEEYNPKSKLSGTLTFNNTSGKATNITNTKGQKNTTLTINATTQFMNRAPLTAVIKFPLNQYKSGNFNARLTLGKIDPVALASVTKPLGLFAADKGMINKLEANIKGNNKSASGNVLLLYNDLKISLYEKEDDEKGLDKKGLIGFFANTFVIKNNNPSSKDEKPRTPEASFQRNEKAGFMNLIWKTVLVGILKTTGANPNIANKK